MPRFDGTGPCGCGPTGWGRGPCRGFRMGWNYPTKDEEKKLLKQELEAINKRLKELEK